jgi:predicted regulator of Ras-like GTPase activity (Roadblock/LC7/MglB family)
VVLSVDGLLTATSTGLPRDDAEHLAAIAAGFSSLAKGAGDRFRGGAVRQTIVEMDQAYLLVSTAGQGSCLAVLAEPDIDLGVRAYEMTMLATRVGSHLGTPSRPGPDGR